jgi:hypothetical protein
MNAGLAQEATYLQSPQAGPFVWSPPELVLAKRRASKRRRALEATVLDVASETAQLIEDRPSPAR